MGQLSRTTIIWIGVCVALVAATAGFMIYWFVFRTTTTTTTSSNHKSAKLLLRSSDLDGRLQMAQKVTTVSGSEYLVPTQVKGSLCYIIGGLGPRVQADRDPNDKQGLVLLGKQGNVLDSRPNTTTCYDFDLTKGTEIEVSEAVLVKPGTSYDVMEHLIMLFNYLDVDYLDHNLQVQSLRFVLATHEQYLLGDMLFKRNGDWYWLDYSAHTWHVHTGPRPDLAKRNDRIKLFHDQMITTDPQLADFPWVPLFVPIKRTDGTVVNPADPNDRGFVVPDVAQIQSITCTMDFSVGKLLLLPGKKGQLLNDIQTVLSVSLITNMMDHTLGEGPGCDTVVGTAMEEFFRGLPVYPAGHAQAGQPIVPEGALVTGEENGVVYREVVPAELKFYDDGRVVQSGELLCDASGIAPELKQDLQDSGILVTFSKFETQK